MNQGYSFDIRFLFCVTGYLFILSGTASAGVCEQAWNGDEFATKFGQAPANHVVRMQDKNQNIVAQLSVAQVMAFHDAKDKISTQAGLAPHFVVCGDADPNAFAIPTQKGPVIGVTAGMVKLVDGDRDKAAFIIGHEVGHHMRNHGQNGQANAAAVGVFATILGAVIEAKNPNSRYPGLGNAAANVGGRLLTAKFSRDQEREADDDGVRYMSAAGYDVNGAVRAAEMLGRQGTSSGLFFDSHPGWDERAGRVRAMIAAQPSLATVARSQSTTSSPTVARYQSTSPQALANEAYRALLQGRDHEAFAQFRQAAEAGNSDGQAGLGFMYATGRGVSRDDTEAAKLYKLSSDQGNSQGQANLAGFVATGRGGLTRDDAEAVRLLKLSADKANAAGQFGLAMMYSQGRGGLSKDDTESAKLLRWSANQGYSAAQAFLGYMTLNGVGGLERDSAEAARLIRASADKGDPIGQAFLGSLCEQGQGGVAQNDIEAIRLYRIAAGKGNRFATERLQTLKALGRFHE